jgi:hypothetical protein
MQSSTAQQQPRKTSPARHLLSGAISGFCCCVLLQPFDLVKTRLQQPAISHLPPHRSSSSSSSRSVVADIVRSDGVFGLWRGTVIIMLSCYMLLCYIYYNVICIIMLLCYLYIDMLLCYLYIDMLLCYMYI